jgi:hypothetical protein
MINKFAWAGFNTGGSVSNPTGYSIFMGTSGAGASAILSNIVMLTLGVIGLLFLLYLIFGAFKYLTAGGDDKAVQEAKKILTNAMVGIGLAVSTFFITDILSEVLGFRNSVIGGITSFNIAGPLRTYAIRITNPTGYTSGVTVPGTQAALPLGDLLNNVTNAVFVIGGILLLVYLLFGAIKYMSAGGDDKAVTSAKNMLTNAVIGILIMFVSFFVVRIAGTVLGMPNILNPTFLGP